MKKAQVVLNVILVVLIAILFFLHFSGRKKQCIATANCSATKDSIGAKHSVIAYVELDSLNSQVTFIRDRKTELDGEQKGIENDYENSYRQLEAEKNNFLKITLFHKILGARKLEGLAIQIFYGRCLSLSFIICPRASKKFSKMAPPEDFLCKL